MSRDAWTWLSSWNDTSVSSREPAPGCQTLTRLNLPRRYGPLDRMVCAPATVPSGLKFRCGNSGTASGGIVTSARSGLTRPPTTDSDERQQSAPQRSAPIRTPIKIPGMKFRASTPKEHPASPTEFPPTVGCGREWGFGHCVTGAIFTRCATVKGFTVRCKRVMCHHDSRHSSRHRGQRNRHAICRRTARITGGSAREDDILRLSMECADLAVHDEQYAATLAGGLQKES